MSAAPTLVAIITASGSETSVPDRADAVDAMIFVKLANHNSHLLDVTLLGGEGDEALDTWGSPDNWCSDYAALCETEFTVGDVVQAVRDAVTLLAEMKSEAAS